MVVVLSLLAATSFALGTVLQQKGTLAGDSGSSSGLRFLAGLFRRPVWLLGGLVTAVGAVCQTLALRTGSLAAVQAMATLSLVIALPLGRWLTQQQLTPVVWAGACATTAGVVLFVGFGSPQAGTSTPGTGAWALAFGASEPRLLGIGAALDFGVAFAALGLYLLLAPVAEPPVGEPASA